MELNPFAVTLHIAIERPKPLKMSKEKLRKWKKELHQQGLSIWDEMIDAIRSEMQSAGIDLDCTTVEIEEDETADQQRMVTVRGLMNDQVETMRAIVRGYCIVSDEDFDPTRYDEDPPDEPWREEARDEDRWWRGETEDDDLEP